MFVLIDMRNFKERTFQLVRIIMIILLGFNSNEILSKTFNLEEGKAISLAYSFQDVDHIKSDPSMFKNRRAVLKLINQQKTFSNNNSRFIFVPIGVMKKGRFQLDLFLKPHEDVYSKASFYVVESKNKEVVNDSFLANQKNASASQFNQFLIRNKFQSYNSMSYNNSCYLEFLKTWSGCQKVYMNQFKKVNFGHFNELKNYLNTSDIADENFYGLVIELDMPANKYDVKDAVLSEYLGETNVIGNQKYPNFIDHLPLNYPQDNSIDSFVGIKAAGNSSFTFSVKLPKTKRNFLTLKLATLSNLNSEGQTGGKANPVSFNVEMSCSKKTTTTYEKKFSSEQIKDFAHIFHEAEIPLPEACASKLITLTLKNTFEKGVGLLFLVDPVVYSIAEKKRPNLIIITADALRYDHTSLGQNTIDTTPFLKALSKNGVNFSNYIVQRSFTQTSLPVMFTGQYPYRHQEIGSYEVKQRLFIQEDIHKMLFENGYQGYSVIGSQTYGKFGQGQQFANRSFFNYISDHESLVRSYSFIRRNTGDRPYFLWVHLKRPHLPYNPDSKTLKFSKEMNIPKVFTNEDKLTLLKRDKKVLKRMVPFIHALYKDNIRNMDVDLSNFFMKLEKETLLDNTVIAFSSDHGENIDEHEQYFQHGTLSNASLKVPLVLVYPGKLPQGTQVNSLVESVDFYPTLLDLLNIKAPDNIDGKSLLKLVNKPDMTYKKYAYSDLDGLFFAIQNLDYKLIVNPRSDSIEGVNFYYPYTHEKIELYDLKKDPNERVNIFKDKKDLAYNLLEKLLPYMSKFEKSNQDGQFTPEMLDLLERTGYLHWKKIKK